MAPLHPPVENWLKAFAKAVRERDFTAGRALFSPSVVSFGTVGHRLNNLEELAAQQWQRVWPQTAGFDFKYDSLQLFEQPGLAVVAAEWASTGFGSDGAPFPRHGRVTLVLELCAGEWKAVHTHFSMGPEKLAS